jgi:hypothetical protein
MWDNLPQGAMDKCERRSEQLRQEYWREFVEKGTRIAKFMGTRDSVFQIVRMLLENNKTPLPLKLQVEMLEYRSLHKTAAGKIVSEKAVKVAAKLRKRIDEAKGEGDDESQQLRDELAFVEDELALLKCDFSNEKNVAPKDTKRAEKEKAARFSVFEAFQKFLQN